MKKRYIYVTVIVLVLVGICITEQIMMNTYLGNTKMQVTALVQEVADQTDVSTPEIYDNLVKIENSWKQYEKNLCFLVNLKDIEDMGKLLTQSKVYVVENNAVELKANLALMLYHIEAYYTMIGISFENIF